MSSTDMAETAYMLKRTCFAAPRKRVVALSSLDWQTIIKRVVDDARPPSLTTRLPFRNNYLAADEDDYYYRDYFVLVEYELIRLSTIDAGLGDRMLWFWHGLLTSGYSEVDVISLLFRQHRLLAKHCLGSFRQMLIDMTIDAAMLTYLGGDGSTGDAPNENYARELMELFTLGRGNYQQSDVGAAALALSGWYTRGYPTKRGPFNPDNIAVLFDPDSSYSSEVNYLGTKMKYEVTSIIDRILEQEVCAKYIAGRLFKYFIHPNPDEESINKLADVFRDADYQIKPLLMALFRHPEFRDQHSRNVRVNLPMETFLCASASLGASIYDLDYKTYLSSTGQMLFDPPNVAGWPLDKRWLSAPQSLARTRLGLKAFNLTKTNMAVKAIANASTPVDEALLQTSLYNVSAQTRDQLAEVSASISNKNTRAKALLSLAIASPEFAIS